MSEEPLGPARLGQLLGMTSGAATTLVDRLERAGHLERRPHESDRRRKVLAVTTSTHERILEELHPVASAVDRFASSFSHAELVVLRRFLVGTLCSPRRCAHSSPDSRHSRQPSRPPTGSTRGASTTSRTPRGPWAGSHCAATRVITQLTDSVCRTF